MKEYVLQFHSSSCQKWTFIKDIRLYPFRTEEEARKELEERKAEHPWNIYRIVVRNVTDWEEVSK